MYKYQKLVGKYLNGYKIIKVENDPFIKGQINLFTDEWEYETFNDRKLVVFRISEEGNTSKYYQELADKRKNDLQQRINKAIEYIEMICELGSYSKSCNLDSEEIEELLSILKGEE